MLKMLAEKPVLTKEHSLTKPKTWGWSLLVGFLLVFLLVNGVHLVAAADSEPVFSFEDTIKDLDLLAALTDVEGVELLGGFASKANVTPASEAAATEVVKKLI